ncbi:MAG: tRNA lysidine(34) synthetase TilS [Legionellales bacterium RIFCSPHIGHO2_12_FULL_35_11]|nr:MAG: tRNA lysidine(34) synthetase TilS [Legionellales bacterium RIFCSPHIGHO2_12_FULL_35_11]
MLISPKWIEELQTFEKIFIAFSGGLDSTVLLHSLCNIPSLRNRLHAIHINHGISEFADDWEKHCLNICLSTNIPLIIKNIKILKKSNIEELARNARYKVFEEIVLENECIVFAHHCNDQAETFLLNLLRGSGVSGLSGMPEIRSLGKGELIRPFLNIMKHRLEDYAEQYKLNWVEDDSNTNVNFSRNYLRHKIIPLLNDKWPAAIRNITNCASKCRDAKENLSDLAELDAKIISYQDDMTLDLSIVPVHDSSRLCNVLKAWFDKYNIKSPTATIYHKLITDVILAKTDANPYFAFGKTEIRRFKNKLYLSFKEFPDNIIQPRFEDNCKYNNKIWDDFPNSCNLNTKLTVIAKKADFGLSINANALIEIRFRKGSETIKKNGHAKKLRNIFQELAVPPWLRDIIPLIYLNGELKLIVGYLAADKALGTVDAFEISLKDTSNLR